MNAPEAADRVSQEPSETWRDQVGNAVAGLAVGALLLYLLMIATRLAGYRLSGLSFVIIPPAVLLASPLRRRFQAGSIPARMVLAAGWLLILAIAVLRTRVLPVGLR
jgi:hypothetical protein